VSERSERALTKARAMNSIVGYGTTSKLKLFHLILLTRSFRSSFRSSSKMQLASLDAAPDPSWTHRPVRLHISTSSFWFMRGCGICMVGNRDLRGGMGMGQLW